MDRERAVSARAKRTLRGWPVIGLGLGLGLVVVAGSQLDLAPPSASSPSADRSSEPLTASPATPSLHAARPLQRRRAEPSTLGAPPQPRAAAPDPHPHPLDEARRALALEQQLIGALNDAMDLDDPSAMRPLIARYRERIPADENKLAAGYERIADCLEQPGDATLAAARAYYDRERASTLRRYVRRHCLER